MSHPNIKMFPEPAAVFADKIEEHASLLFPLFSVGLKQINPEWSGSIHMLQFNEDPYNRDCVDTFNDYCKDNMIGFDVIDGKYSFKTDFRYFDCTPDWQEWFEKTKSTFNSTRQRYRETGELINSFGNPKDGFEQIGGEPEWIQGDATPSDPDGKPMTFIARAYTGDYTNDSCPKDLYLFYSHEHKLAVIIYQIT